MKQKEDKYIKLISENQNLIYKVASMYARTIESREDLMQDIAYQIWKSFDSFESRSSQSTWLYRIALNTAIQSLKKEKRQVSTEDFITSTYFQQDEASSEQDVAISQLMSAIQSLKQIDKAIILLYLEEKSYQEISAITDLTVTNVGTRIQRIKKKLKSILNNS